MDTWRNKILRYVEDQICMMMIPQREHRFENEVNPDLNYYHFADNEGKGPIQYHVVHDEMAQVTNSPPPRKNRFMAPRNPIPGFNTPLRHFISNPIKNEDMTGINTDNKTPAIYLQVFGGVQDPNTNPHERPPTQGRLDHSVETFQLIIHGVFRDDSKPRMEQQCDYENPNDPKDPDNTKIRKRKNKQDQGLYNWYGNGYDWQNKKEGCERIQNLMAYLEDRRLELPSNPPVPEMRWHRSMNEQIIDFIDDIEYLLNVANLQRIRVDTLMGGQAPSDPSDMTTLADNDAFISKAWFGNWQLFKMSKNSPVNVVSFPLIMQVHFPIVRK